MINDQSLDKLENSIQNIWVVVPAAGMGRRVGGEIPKQYLRIKNKTIIEYTLETLLALPFVQGLVVVLHAEDQWWQNLPIAQHARVFTTTGGETRQHSVLQGLFALRRARDDDWVLVHDAARPCVAQEKIHALCLAAKHSDVGAILGVPVVDTIKRVNAEGQIECTEPRDGLWQAHTPQIFRLAQLQKALSDSLEDDLLPTDEASAIERMGLSVAMVEDRRDNIKVTVKEDLKRVEAFLDSGLQHS